MQIIAIKEYSDNVISLYEGEIRNISDALAQSLIDKGVAAPHDEDMLSNITVEDEGKVLTVVNGKAIFAKSSGSENRKITIPCVVVGYFPGTTSPDWYGFYKMTQEQFKKKTLDAFENSTSLVRIKAVIYWEYGEGYTGTRVSKNIQTEFQGNFDYDTSKIILPVDSIWDRVWDEKSVPLIDGIYGAAWGSESGSFTKSLQNWPTFSGSPFPQELINKITKLFEAFS